jgi:hypothetical protein
MDMDIEKSTGIIAQSALRELRALREDRSPPIEDMDEHAESGDGPGRSSESDCERSSREPQVDGDTEECETAEECESAGEGG